MKSLEKIREKAYIFKLNTEYIAHDTLKVYSDKYNFDSWLIKEEDNYIELLHINKARRNRNCTYHIQGRFRKHNWFWALQRINSHNVYKTEYVSKNPSNLVDRVMYKYNGGAYNG